MDNSRLFYMVFAQLDINRVRIKNSIAVIFRGVYNQNRIDATERLNGNGPLIFCEACVTACNNQFGTVAEIFVSDVVQAEAGAICMICGEKDTETA